MKSTVAHTREILKHIPHRYPFVLIDRIDEYIPGVSVRAVKNVTRNEWFIRPGAAAQCMPQMLVLEALAQAAGALCHYSGAMSAIANPLIFFAGIDRTRLDGAVPAPSQLILTCTLSRILRGVARIRGVASVNDRVVAESDLTAVIRETPED